MGINRCKCGKLLKMRNSKRCPVCTRYHTDIIRTNVSKTMTEDEIEALVLERTKKFRRKLSDMANNGNGL